MPPQLVADAVEDRLSKVGLQRAVTSVLERRHRANGADQRVLHEVVRIGHVARPSRQPAGSPAREPRKITLEQPVESDFVAVPGLLEKSDGRGGRRISIGSDDHADHLSRLVLGPLDGPIRSIRRVRRDGDKVSWIMHDVRHDCPSSVTEDCGSPEGLRYTTSVAEDCGSHEGLRYPLGATTLVAQGFSPAGRLVQRTEHTVELDPYGIELLPEDLMALDRVPPDLLVGPRREAGQIRNMRLQPGFAVPDGLGQ